eukprot:4520959-Amphidinium_carterae.3
MYFYTDGLKRKSARDSKSSEQQAVKSLQTTVESLSKEKRSRGSHTSFLESEPGLHEIDVNAEGGVLFPKDSVPLRKLEKHATKLWYQYEHEVEPLYQERAVYNLYVKPSAGLSEQNLGATSAAAASAAIPSIVGGQLASSAVRPQARSTRAGHPHRVGCERGNRGEMKLTPESRRRLASDRA